jgi:hypothetical protein
MLFLFCFNVVLLAIIGSYDIRIGFIHLTAHGLFKPILMMNGCFFFVLMVYGISNNKFGNSNPDTVEQKIFPAGRHFLVYLLLIMALVIAVHGPFITINFDHHDWTHRHISKGIDSLASACKLFVTPQADGFYRPLTFLSLWLDHSLFGTEFAGYHLQSLGLHILNSLLTAWLAATLSLGKASSLWAGACFAVAAVNFEAILWPAARFDLLSTLFCLLALIFIIRYLKQGQLWNFKLIAALLFYMLGILSKESSYCFPLLLCLIIFTHSLWAIPRLGKNKIVLCVSLVFIATLLMVFIRIIIYGNLGGYPTSVTAASPHFQLGIRTVTSLLRAFPITLLGVNTTAAAPEWLGLVLIVFTLFIIVTAVAGRHCFKRKGIALLSIAFLSVIPVLNIVGWIGAPMQHSRYLYMPTVFVMIIIAFTPGRIRWRAGVLGVFLAANALGAVSNYMIYRTMLAKTETIAESVHLDWISQNGTHAIHLIDLPENPCGVFFFAPELIKRIQDKIPGARILRTHINRADDKAELKYRWNYDVCTLVRIGKRGSAAGVHK